MKTVTLYQWENKRHTPGWESKFGYTFEPTDGSGWIAGDPNGTEYAIPEGYTWGETEQGEKGIFDPKGMLCDIVHEHGMPKLVSARGIVPMVPLGK